MVVETHEMLQNVVHSHFQESERVGLKINLNKTKIMINNIKTSIKLKNTEVEYIEQYIRVHLNQTNSFINKLDEKIRTSLAWKKYWSLRALLRHTVETNTIYITILNI